MRIVQKLLKILCDIIEKYLYQRNLSGKAGIVLLKKQAFDIFKFLIPAFQTVFNA